MPTTIVKQIYFGKFQDLDPTEASATTGNYNNDWNELQEVPGWRAGISFKRPAIDLIDVAQNDTARQGTAGNNRLEENDFKNAPSTGGGPGPIGADSIAYNLGSGPVTSDLDSTFRWNIELTLVNGTKVMKAASFIQLEDGSIFSNFDNADFANLQIASIKLVSYISGSFYGAVGKRSLTSVQLLCFSADARIMTPKGEIAAGNLRVGDLVTTRDHGAQPIMWVMKRRVSHEDIAQDPNLAPILIQAGSFGSAMPREALILSPQHRVLVSSSIVQRMFGAAEALVPIKHLRDYPGIAATTNLPGLTYVHLALAQHEIVYANGLPSETLYPGKMVLDAFPAEDQTGLHALYAQREVQPARYFVSRGEAETLVRRHLKNRRSLIEGDSVLMATDSVPTVVILS